MDLVDYLTFGQRRAGCSSGALRRLRRAPKEDLEKCLSSVVTKKYLKNQFIYSADLIASDWLERQSLLEFIMSSSGSQILGYWTLEVSLGIELHLRWLSFNFPKQFLASYPTSNLTRHRVVFIRSSRELFDIHFPKILNPKLELQADSVPKDLIFIKHKLASSSKNLISSVNLIHVTF